MNVAVDDQQSRCTTVDVTISPEAMRQSNLLAFAFTDEQAGLGPAVMCSYNPVNVRWACESGYLLDKR